jgi:hypothetical protein
MSSTLEGEYISLKHPVDTLMLKLLIVLGYASFEMSTDCI